MNLNPFKWFWSQYLVVLGFVSVYLVMSLCPWYYNYGAQTEGAKPRNARQVVVDRLKQNLGSTPTTPQQDLTEFEKKYKNEGRLSSLDLLIVAGYLLSLSYVFGLFLTSKRNAIAVNIPLLLLLLLKTLLLVYYRDSYKISLKNVTSWWIALAVYLILFNVNDKTIITEVEYKE